MQTWQNKTCLFGHVRSMSGHVRSDNICVLLGYNLYPRASLSLYCQVVCFLNSQHPGVIAVPLNFTMGNVDVY